MPQRDDAWLRHQQTRWLRPDGDRWVRPDAARFLIPGSDPVDSFPVLAFKYSPTQPRVPAGHPDGGQWTSEGGGFSAQLDPGPPPSNAQPMGNFDPGDVSSLGEELGLFQIAPSKPDRSGVRLAGDSPEGGTPSEKPPEIPQQMPETRDERMGFVREAARWIARVGRFAPAVDAFLGALDQIEEINRLADMIRTANDPPLPLQELQDRVLTSAEPGYHKHNLAEESAARDAGDPESLIQGRDNLVQIPILKHIEITRYYATAVRQADGTYLSPRDQLRGADFETRRQFGIDVLRRYGVLK
ncbi:MAG: hypothetical protein HXX15_13135 [Rhodopseudomonas sp.]|uniref:hypothetical protein n=1 Tax=Rhodopseudomonas sp. TaxID=1078 RepID=UPI0018341331|nr:hypothetical protein [Rhodopseudomonas sp.]NVN87018.1 hypothetical protein [Rhodopseudomonas sp.]